MKKVLGVVFYLMCILGTVGSMMNGLDNVISMITTLALMFLFFFSGLFLLRFDWTGEGDYLVKCNFRQKKRTGTKAFMIIYLVLFLLVLVSPIFLELQWEANLYYQDSYIMLLLLYAVPALPYFFGFFVFVELYVCYFPGLDACTKHFGEPEHLHKTYLADPKQFQPICPNGSVLASDQVLFFPKVFCVIPLKEIANIKRTDVNLAKFVLKSGVKISVCTARHKHIKAFLEEKGILK